MPDYRSGDDYAESASPRLGFRKRLRQRATKNLRRASSIASSRLQDRAAAFLPAESGSEAGAGYSPAVLRAPELLELVPACEMPWVLRQLKDR